MTKLGLIISTFSAALLAAGAAYELDGDTYRYCLAPPGKPRPTAFASPPGSGLSLGVSRRQKP